jgi:hypothetical protein
MNPVNRILGYDVSKNKVLQLTNDEKKRYDNISQQIRDRQVNLQCLLCGNAVLASTYGPIKTIYYSKERILQLKGRCNKCKKNVDGGYNLTHNEFLLEKEFKSKKYESYTIKIRPE